VFLVKQDGLSAMRMRIASTGVTMQWQLRRV
jgi:hypothetical protein